MQVPALESIPVYSMDSQRQFFEAFKHVNFLHNILMMVIFIIITFTMEWCVCVWLNNKLNFSKKIVQKYLMLALAVGIFSFILDIITNLSLFTSSAQPDVFTETLKTWMGIPLILDLVLITPTLEEL